MTTIVTVDSRPGENGLYGYLQEMMADDMAVTLDRSTLEIGDVRIISGNRTILIERKTWADLCSSLRDGRYLNQKARLLAERERRSGEDSFVFVYLIEGYPPAELGKTHSTPNSNAYAALTKMAIRDGIASIWSATAEDAARRVVYIARTSAKDGFNAETEYKKHERAGYASFVKHTSKRKNCNENQFNIMLMCIPGVSARIAAALTDLYPTARSLMDALEEAKAKGRDKRAFLADLQMDSKRKLGIKLSERLCDLFS
jgi:ERCC4-type nuclease